jgi:hypothetical protein
MPIGDTIFRRLRAATAAERAGVADALGVKLEGDVEVDAVALSKTLRSAAGHTFGNVFRGDHDLEYREILADLLPPAGQAAGWAKVAAPDTATEEMLEDYIATAMACAADPAYLALPSDAKARMRVQAEARLGGQLQGAGFDANDGARLGAPAAGVGAALLAAPVLALAVAPVSALAVAIVALCFAAPAVKKTLPACLFLIQVRKRLEVEAELGGVTGAVR